MRRRDFIRIVVGSAVGFPFAARAQQPDRVRHIGYLNVGAENDPEIQTLTRELTQRLQELGWSSGRNVLIDFRFGGSDPMRISQLATELVEGHPDLIIASGTAGAAALRQQSLSIPIVFVQVVDPVLAGFVTNLARPEGNITGFTNFEFSVGGKWLQLLKQCAPAISRIAVVFDPANPSWTAYLRTIEAAAPSFGVQLTPVGVRDAAEIKQRVAVFAREPNGAIVVFPSPVTVQYRESIIAAAAEQRLPAMYPYRFFTVDGGLMSYGSSLLDVYRGAASYADRILKGAKVAELPVQQPTKYQLVINLKTAKTLSLIVPQSLLASADEVIE
jgi:putative tryptophan/tyrosine transport system substrate-binding protein